MNNPIKNLTGKEWILWLGSLAIVIISNMVSEKIDILTLIAACVGVTSLIFAADTHGRFQYFVWDYFMAVSLLGRNDHLSWNDHADGGMVDDHLDPESRGKRQRSCHSAVK